MKETALLLTVLLLLILLLKMFKEKKVDKPPFHFWTGLLKTAVKNPFSAKSRSFFFVQERAGENPGFVKFYFFFLCKQAMHLLSLAKYCKTAFHFSNIYMFYLQMGYKTSLKAFVLLGLFLAGHVTKWTATIIFNCHWFSVHTLFTKFIIITAEGHSVLKIVKQLCSKTMGESVEKTKEIMWRLANRDYGLVPQSAHRGRDSHDWPASP